MAEEPYIPRDLMGVPIPQSAAEEIIGGGTPSGDDPQGISQQQVNSYLLNERPPQGIGQQVIQGSPVHGYINANVAPETSTPTQTASSSNISGVLNVDDLLQLSGRYNRGDAEYEIPENIKIRFGLQNPEFRNRGYEGTATVKPSEVLNGNAPDWMTLDKVSVTYGQERNRFIDPAGGVHKSGTRTRGAEIGLGIGDLGLAAEYMERGLYDDPNREFSVGATYPLGDGRISGEFRRNLNPGSQEQREFSAGATYPLGDGQVSGEFRRNLNPGPQQEDETYIGAKFTRPFQEGGIASLPQNPVLGGQQHMLAYITPEEASTLRAQGGGVTPDGGQRRGPGGIASFVVGGEGATSSPPSGQAQASTPGNVGTGSTSSGTGTGDGGPSPYGDTNPDFSVSEGLFGLATADTAMGNILSKTVKADDLSLAKAIANENAAILAGLPALESVTMDKFNKLSNSQINSIFGKYAGEGLGLHGKEFSKTDIANMTPAEFSALSSNPATSVIGDPNSVFGQAVSGLGLAALSLMAPALSIPTSIMSLARSFAAEPGDPPTGVMGLAANAAADAFGFNSASDAANAVASAVGFGDSPVGDVTSVFSGLAGDAFSGLASSVGDAVSSVSVGPSTASAPSVPGGPSLPPIALTPLSATLIPEYAPVTTETLLDATSSDYTAEQLAQSTGATVAQAQAYLDSRYAQLT